MGWRNIDMEPLQNPLLFRKLSMGSWGNISDPQVYGILEVDCEKALAYLEELNQACPQKITMTHLIGRAIALAFHKYPQLNGMISRGKIYIRKNIDVFFYVHMENAETELVGVNIKNADQKGLVQFAQEVTGKVERVRSSPEEPLRKSQHRFKKIPWRLVPSVLRLLNWIRYDLNINLSWLGLPKDGLGSVMVTSIGSFGAELAFAPLNRLQRAAALVSIGIVKKRPVVIDDQIVIRQRVNLCYTFDHRFIDGFLGAKIGRYLIDLIENIDQYKDLIEGTPKSSVDIPVSHNDQSCQQYNHSSAEVAI